MTKLLHSIVLTTALVAAGCSSGADTSGVAGDSSAAPADPGLAAAHAAVACFQDRGMSAELADDGTVSFDLEGTLTQDQSMALVEECDKELIDAGILPDPMSEENLRASYARFQLLRECLMDAGFSVPELVSYEAYVAGVRDETFEHPIAAVLRVEGDEAMKDIPASCWDL